MTTQAIYVIWNDDEGNDYSHFYLDKKSAMKDLIEQYESDWIENGRAQVRVVNAISYFE